jgi:hypothetical protein
MEHSLKANDLHLPLGTQVPSSKEYFTGLQTPCEQGFKEQCYCEQWLAWCEAQQIFVD